MRILKSTLLICLCQKQQAMPCYKNENEVYSNYFISKNKTGAYSEKTVIEQNNIFHDAVYGEDQNKILAIINDNINVLEKIVAFNEHSAMKNVADTFKKLTDILYINLITSYIRRTEIYNDHICRHNISSSSFFLERVFSRRKRDYHRDIKYELSTYQNLLKISEEGGKLNSIRHHYLFVNLRSFTSEIINNTKNSVKCYNPDQEIKAMKKIFAIPISAITSQEKQTIFNENINNMKLWFKEIMNIILPILSIHILYKRLQDLSDKEKIEYKRLQDLSENEKTEFTNDNILRRITSGESETDINKILEKTRLIYDFLYKEKTNNESYNEKSETEKSKTEKSETLSMLYNLNEIMKKFNF